MNGYKVYLTALFIGLAIGNFSYQFFTDKNYWLAWDRTYFQGIALLGIWVIDRINTWIK